MTDDTKILYKDYTEEEPYEGDCCPPNYWTCEKGVGITLPEYALSRSLTYEGARRKILKYSFNPLKYSACEARRCRKAIVRVSIELYSYLSVR